MSERTPGESGAYKTLIEKIEKIGEYFSEQINALRVWMQEQFGKIERRLKNQEDRIKKLAQQNTELREQNEELRELVGYLAGELNVLREEFNRFRQSNEQVGQTDHSEGSTGGTGGSAEPQGRGVAGESGASEPQDTQESTSAPHQSESEPQRSQEVPEDVYKAADEAQKAIKEALIEKRSYDINSADQNKGKAELEAINKKLQDKESNALQEVERALKVALDNVRTREDLKSLKYYIKSKENLTLSLEKEIAKLKKRLKKLEKDLGDIDNRDLDAREKLRLQIKDTTNKIAEKEKELSKTLQDIDRLKIEKSRRYRKAVLLALRPVLESYVLYKVASHYDTHAWEKVSDIAKRSTKPVASYFKLWGIRRNRMEKKSLRDLIKARYAYKTALNLLEGRIFRKSLRSFERYLDSSTSPEDILKIIDREVVKKSVEKANSRPVLAPYSAKFSLSNILRKIRRRY